MPHVRLEMILRAPIERCFDLSRSLDFHVASFAHTGERAVAGQTSGLLGLGESVTWEARHFGIKQRLTAAITAIDAPHHFRDSMVRGAFARFDHDHYFEATASGTRMRDVFDFDAPLGPLGKLANVLFLRRYVEKLLTTRNAHLKAAVESDQWRAFLPAPSP